jgi:hypothetical protein
MVVSATLDMKHPENPGSLGGQLHRGVGNIENKLKVSLQWFTSRSVYNGSARDESIVTTLVIVSLHYSGSPPDEFPFSGPPKYVK